MALSAAFSLPCVLFLTNYISFSLSTHFSLACMLPLLLPKIHIHHYLFACFDSHRPCRGITMSLQIVLCCLCWFQALPVLVFVLLSLSNIIAAFIAQNAVRHISSSFFSPSSHIHQPTQGNTYKV